MCWALLGGSGHAPAQLLPLPLATHLQQAGGQPRVEGRLWVFRSPSGNERSGSCSQITALPGREGCGSAPCAALGSPVWKTPGLQGPFSP